MAKADYTEGVVFPRTFLLNPATKGRRKDKRRRCNSVISVFTMADWQAAKWTFKLNMEKISVVLGNKPAQCPSPKKWIFLVILKPSCAFWHGLTFAPWSGSSILWYQTANFKHCWSQKKWAILLTTEALEKAGDAGGLGFSWQFCNRAKARCQAVYPSAVDSTLN